MGRFKTNMNKLKSDLSSFESGGGGANWFKLVDGKQVIRLMPPWSEEGVFYKKVGYHRPPGRSEANKKVVCPNYTYGEKDACPICKARAKVFKDLGKDAARPYAIQKRALVNVLDMKKADGVVYVLDAAASIMNPILNFMAEEDSDQILDPNKGYNVLVVRKNDGGFTKYEVMIKPGEFDLEAKGYDVDDILENLNDLDSFVKEPDPDDFSEILEALNANAYGEDEAEVGIDDDDDDTPAPKSAKKKLQSKKVVDDDDDEEEEEAPAPKAKKKAKPVAAVEDDEEEEGEEEEDEPAPKPAAKKKAKPVVVEDEEEEEDDEPAPKAKAKANGHANGKLKKKAKPAVDDDDDEVDPDLSGVNDIEDFDGVDFDENEEIPF